MQVASYEVSIFKRQLPATQLYNYVASLLTRGYHVDTKDNCGRTALMHVVTAKYVDVSTIEILLEENADIYTTDDEGSNALSLLIEKSHTWLKALPPETKHLQILVMFFEKVRSDFLADRELTVQRIRNARCPMSLIPFLQNATIVKYLYENVRDLIQYDRGLTILHGAILVQDLKTVRFLTENCVDLNGVPTILFAYNVNTMETHEKIQMLTILLKHGASLYVPWKDGLTPVKYLLKNGSQETRSTVLRQISPEKCKYYKVAALHYLLENQHYYKMAGLHYLLENKKRNQDLNRLNEELNILLSRGFDANIRNEKGINALTVALKHGQNVHSTLMRYGVEVDWIEIVEETPILRYLANENYWGHNYFKEIISRILQYQFGINIFDLYKILNKEVVSEKIDKLFYIQIVISNYAISKVALNHPIFNDVSMENLLEKHADVCHESIRQLKAIKVSDSVTLYQLLIKSENDFEKHIMKPSFALELQNVINQKCFDNLYYVIIIRKKFESALKINALRKKSGSVVCQLTGLDRYGVNEHHYIVYKIVSYLNKRDIFKLLGCQPELHDGIIKPTPVISSLSRNWITRTLKKIFL